MGIICASTGCRRDLSALATIRASRSRRSTETIFCLNRVIFIVDLPQHRLHVSLTFVKRLAPELSDWNARSVANTAACGKVLYRIMKLLLMTGVQPLPLNVLLIRCTTTDA